MVNVFRALLFLDELDLEWFFAWFRAFRLTKTGNTNGFKCGFHGFGGKPWGTLTGWKHRALFTTTLALKLKKQLFGILTKDFWYWRTIWIIGGFGQRWLPGALSINIKNFLKQTNKLNYFS